MKISFIEVCVFAIVITTAHTLRCIKCQLENEASKNLTCQGTEEECYPEEVCMTQETFVLKSGNLEKQMTSRGCTDPNQCGISESFTAMSYTGKVRSSCCNTDLCTPPPLVLPENTTKNGIICPTCYSDTTEDCVPKASMECRGEETSCIFYKENAFLFLKYNLNALGCGTQNICKDNGEWLKSPNLFIMSSCLVQNSTTSQLPNANLLWCRICHKDNADNCNSNPFQCAPHEDVCLSQLIRNKYAGRDSKQIIRKCGLSNECKRTGTITSNLKYISMNTTCCDINHCNPPTPTLPPLIKTRNGLSCPACFVPNSDRCLGRDPVHCTGKENRCIHYVKKEIQDISSVTETLFGCSTHNICDAGSMKINLYGNYYQDIRIDIICNKAIRSCREDNILLASIITILTVIKLLIFH